MKPKKKEAKPELESVKIERDIVDLVRENKSKNDTPIGKFFKLAAQEKLQKLQSK